MQMTESRRWRFKGSEMEGPIARWYARLRGSASQLDVYREQARELVAGLPSGAQVLEVAPGPGFLAIEIARLGKVHVTGLDISRTFVEIAAAKARGAGVTVEFRQGDAAQMPFASDSFDMIVCQAAFKNFSRPGTALAEMHRVLRAGGKAVIQDMSNDATHTDIDDEVNGMDLGWFSAFTTRATLEMLKRRAYSPQQLRQLAAESPFRTCQITTSGVGLEVQLKKEKDQ
ncbi:MAG TPA: class I SAM-dependent methyltransferase [Candidatus Dormibacteraeota bacterium]|nr:class I SAM-dependent methyltransferase [Candidatus Dormibacteraeota bacterium]